MKADNIFISYSRTDSDFVIKLEEDLAKAGIDIWLDQKKISGGTPWDRAIEEALEVSGIMILVISPNSALSENVADEVQYARDEGKIIVPILIEQTKIPLTWRRYQRIDFVNDYELAINNLAQTLKHKMSLMLNNEIAKEEQRIKAEVVAAAKQKDAEEKRIKEEVEKKLKAIEELRLKEKEKAEDEEEKLIKDEAEAKQKREEEQRLKKEAEAKQKAEEEKRIKEETEAKRKAEEELKLKKEAEAKQKAEEEKRINAEAESKRIEEERLRKEAEFRKQQEVYLKQQEAKRLKEEEEIKIKLNEEKLKREAQKKKEQEQQEEERLRNEAEFEKQQKYQKRESIEQRKQNENKRIHDSGKIVYKCNYCGFPIERGKRTLFSILIISSLWIGVILLIPVMVEEYGIVGIFGIITPIILIIAPFMGYSLSWGKAFVKSQICKNCGKEVTKFKDYEEQTK